MCIAADCLNSARPGVVYLALQPSTREQEFAAPWFFERQRLLTAAQFLLANSTSTSEILCINMVKVSDMFFLLN